MTAPSDLTRMTAQAVVRLLRQGRVSPLELIDAALARIAATDGVLNALPTLCPDRARDRARRLMESASAVAPGPGWLGGLPLAVKDLNDVAGVRTTYGSPIYADQVPARSDILVERLEANGGVVLAKSNTPEFGAGANTFNAVFGETLNPWNPRLTVGGSSGGSAAALAAGQVWLATGSDLGGSLRTPASFCSVVGLRPGPGRVPHGPEARPFDTLSVDGPMGRTVGDVALMLDAIVARHPEDPLSLDLPQEAFQIAAAERRLPQRVAFSPDLGITPVDAEVRQICEAAARRFGAAGAIVEEACPDFSGAAECFGVLRALGFVAGRRLSLEHYEKHRDKLKPDVIWNIERGLALTAGDIARAELARGALYHRVVAFFRSHDLLLCPAACVPPFDVGTRWLKELNGIAFDNYVEWIRITYAVTLTSCPALSLPCGFTRDGRPVGLQMVGRPRGEAELLGAAAALEEILDIAKLVPLDPRPAG
jgi:amidase